MINFKQANFGDKYIFKRTGEVCELISKSDCSADLRPIDYKGLMVYSEIFGCPNEQTHWETYDGDWNLINQSWFMVTPETYVLCGSDNLTFDNEMFNKDKVIRYSDIKTLKEKIIEDIEDFIMECHHSDLDFHHDDEIKEYKKILTKRFGF